MLARLCGVLLLFTALLSAEWITPKGKTYHTHADCIALRSTKSPSQISADDAQKRGLHLCGICARRKSK